MRVACPEEEPALALHGAKPVDCVCMHAIDVVSQLVTRNSILSLASLLISLSFAPVLGAQELTLRDAVAIAQRQGYSAKSAAAAVEAARRRDDSFHSRLFPQLSLRGTAPDINRAITPVIQPDGTTQFVEQSQMSSSLTLEVSQPIKLTGGELFVS